MTTEAPTTSTTTNPKPRIRFLGGTRYVVESKSQPGIGRQVDTLTLRCSCPASAYGRRCWHLSFALQYESWRKHEQAKAKARATSGKGASAPIAPAPAPVPATPAVEGDWHTSAAYLGLAAAFGA